MPEVVVKELIGFSGSIVTLMNDTGQNLLFVRKQGNTDRNYKQLMLLADHGLNVPIVYNKHGDTLDMEYIAGLDMKTYILMQGVKVLGDFIISTIRYFRTSTYTKNYLEVYNKHLEFVNSDPYLPFSKDELIAKIPIELPQSLHHGDFTLENIIYARNDKFYLIDAVTCDYDSWIFDIAKLRQDIEGKWFIRNQDVMLDSQLLHLKNRLKKEMPEAFNDYFYILMLLRVYVHAIPNSKEHQFILTEINKLWK